jgi:hypothetical protein
MRTSAASLVIAGTQAVQRYEPDADVIELGGQDAKITSRSPNNG